MAIPEFISVLRKIRDVIYPEINELYDNSLILKESIDVGKAEFDADLIQFNTDYSDFNIKKTQVDASVVSANNSALSASQSAQTATNKSNEIKAITAQSTTGAPGTQASASYNPTDGKFTFNIPQGIKGDKGESFTVNSSGITASRTLYDAQPTGWSFLDITTSTLYFKASNTSGDWSSGVPFGKGDTGETGEQGVGIASFTFVSTSHTSGLHAQSGGIDTYRVTLTNTNTFDYQVYNGLDASLEYVDTQVGNVQTNLNTTNTLINSHISVGASYHLLGGNLSVDNTVLTNGFGLYLYTGNTTTLPTINLGMDITSQWGNTADETYGYLIKIKSRSAIGDWTWVNSVRGITKYISSNTTAVEGTDVNMFTLNTVAGVTTLNIGTSTRTNTNGVIYVVEVYQTTHRKTGVTNQGKTFTEHYNTDTGFTINGYEGSGLAGHEIPHSLGRKLDILHIKNLSAVTQWISKSQILQANYVLSLNQTIASTLSAIDDVTLGENSSTIYTSGQTNNATNQHIMFGWRNRYFDESGKLIGNFEIGVYQGTGATGNKVITRGKPAWIMVKRLDATGAWRIADNMRTDKHLEANTAIAELQASLFTYQNDGFTHTSTVVEYNASGGQYLYMVVYDNDSGSGKSKYYKATDIANVQINNGIIPLTHGIDSNGSKNSIVVANETITGLTYTEGKNYLYKTDTGYGVKPYKPRYLKSELVRTFAGEQPDYFNIESNKWFNCDAGDELIANGTFSSGVTTGWIGRTGITTLSVVSNTLKALNSSTGNGYVTATIATEIGKKYTLKFKLVYSSSSTYGFYIENVIGNADIYNSGIISASNAIVSIDFIAQSTTTYITLINGTSTLNAYNQWDDVSVFPVAIAPTTEITESRNYMNHIVHADADGGVLYTEELPKIEYKNVIKANINSNRKYVNYTNKRFFGVEYKNDLPYDIDVILTSTCIAGTSTGTYVNIDDVSIQFDSARDATYSHTLPVKVTIPSGSKFLFPTSTSISINSWFQYE